MRITSFTDDFTMSVLSHIKQAAQIHTPQPFQCATLHFTTVMPTYWCFLSQTSKYVIQLICHKCTGSHQRYDTFRACVKGGKENRFFFKETEWWHTVQINIKKCASSKKRYYECTSATNSFINTVSFLHTLANTPLTTCTTRLHCSTRMWLLVKWHRC